MKQRDKKQDKNPVRKSHSIAFRLIRGLSFLYSRIFLGYGSRDNYKIKTGERVLVLSNHQTDADPFCILPAFNRPVYPVATDNIFAGKFRSKLFSALGVIPKKKGVVD
ncbi:MAG: 1-acyl-sn-glycerol-3-phosphate acyltransferase, partial [Clostridia bacterium]|nr:1-acyl-sn-glycerol-3-phosphate acyltransferase [Clostridia bacterium]